MGGMGVWTDIRVVSQTRAKWWGKGCSGRKTRELLLEGRGRVLKYCQPPKKTHKNKPKKQRNKKSLNYTPPLVTQHPQDFHICDFKHCPYLISYNLMFNLK